MLMSLFKKKEQYKCTDTVYLLSEEAKKGLQWALITTECYGLYPLMLEIGFYMDKVQKGDKLDHEAEYKKIEQAYKETIRKIEHVNDLIKQIPKGEVEIYVK